MLFRLTLLLFLPLVGLTGCSCETRRNPVGQSLRVVLVLDQDLPMRHLYASAANAMSGAISDLRPDEQFNVILSRKNPIVLADQLLDATKQNRDNAIDFLMGHGGVENAQLESALNVAIARKPDVIWLASSGNFESPERVFAAVHRARETDVPIYTLSSYAESMSHRQALLKLAEASGGKCLNEDGGFSLTEWKSRDGPDAMSSSVGFKRLLRICRARFVRELKK